MVDDFIGQGGTLANLRGWIEEHGGKVVAAVALTGKPYSANPSLTYVEANSFCISQLRGAERASGTTSASRGVVYTMVFRIPPGSGPTPKAS